MIKGMGERTPGSNCTSCKRHSNCKGRFPVEASFSTVYADPLKSSKKKINATPQREINSLDSSPIVSRVCKKTPAKRTACRLPLSSQFSEESTSNCNTDLYNTPIQSTRVRQNYDHKRCPLISLRGNDANSAISKAHTSLDRKCKPFEPNSAQKVAAESQSKSISKRRDMSCSESPNGATVKPRPSPKSAEKGGVCSFCKAQPYTSESVCFIANDGRIAAARISSVLTRSYHQCSYCRCTFGPHNRASSVSTPSKTSRRPASTISEPLSNKLSSWPKSSQSEPVSMKTSCDLSDDLRNCTCGYSSNTTLQSDSPSNGMQNGSPPKVKDEMHQDIHQALPGLLNHDSDDLHKDINSDKSDVIHQNVSSEVEDNYHNAEDAQPTHDQSQKDSEGCRLQVDNGQNQKPENLDISYADPECLPTHLASNPFTSEQKHEALETRNGNILSTTLLASNPLTSEQKHEALETRNGNILSTTLLVSDYENSTVQEPNMEPISPQQIQCERRLDFSQCNTTDDTNVAGVSMFHRDENGQHESESFTHYEDNDEPCSSLSSPHSNWLDQANESCKIDFRDYESPRTIIENHAAFKQDEGEINDFINSMSYHRESYHGDNEYSCSEDGIDLTPRSLVDAMDFEHWSDSKTDNKEKMSGLARMRRRYLNALREQAEMEKVMLKKQEIKARKQAEDWMLNCHMEEVLHKLAPNGEARVKVLIKAFETIMQYSDSESDSQAKDLNIPKGL